MSAIGYPDFRRQQDLDTTAPFATYSATNVFDNQNLGPFNLSNFAYFAGNLRSPTAAFRLEVRYYEDAALTIYCGLRHLYFDTLSGIGTTFRIPALARYAFINVRTQGGVNIALTGMVQGSNRPTANEYVPEDPTILYQNIVGLGAGATATVNALAMGSGRASCWLSTAGQPGVVYLLGLNGLFGYQTFAGGRALAASDNTFDITLPLSPLQVFVGNTGGAAANYSVAVTVDTSGG